MALTILVIFVLVATGQTGDKRPTPSTNISVIRVSTGENHGYGYRMQYTVPVWIDAFWRFKTDFDNVFLVINEQLVGHFFVHAACKTVITEYRYATAPESRFLWQTTVYADQYRMGFTLLNAEDCRHDFHYGSIPLTPAGNATVVAQTAFFNFSGASVWVRYPWRGGMKSTLTKTYEWEQEVASRYARGSIEDRK